jgi:hypothetical protein
MLDYQRHIRNPVFHQGRVAENIDQEEWAFLSDRPDAEMLD